MTISVLIADDQSLVRAGLAAILESDPAFEVVARCADGLEAVDAARLHRPDVALLDIRMPRMDGLEAARQILQPGSTTRVVILTTFGRDDYVRAAIRLGTSGFLLKDAGPDLLKEAVRAAAVGDALVSPELTVRLLAELGGGPAPAPQAEALTERELEIVRRLARGLSNAELARELYISLGTVKSHLANIQSKLSARNRVEIASWAWESGLMGE